MTRGIDVKTRWLLQFAVVEVPDSAVEPFEYDSSARG